MEIENTPFHLVLSIDSTPLRIVHHVLCQAIMTTTMNSYPANKRKLKDQSLLPRPIGNSEVNFRLAARDQTAFLH
jgi:hypothetical protein